MVVVNLYGEPPLRDPCFKGRDGGRRGISLTTGKTSALSMTPKNMRDSGLNPWLAYGAILLVSVWLGTSPPMAHSLVPPPASNTSMAGKDWLESRQPNRSWSAFRSNDAKNVCVTVVNYGASEVSVHLFRNRFLAGAFTVYPQEASAVCSDVTVIELECKDESCLPQWYISDFY